MKLTGQCKTDFEKWLFDKKYTIESEPIINTSTDEWESIIIHFDTLFEQLPFSMQYGVYVDWFDSVGLVIDIHPCACHKPTIFNVNIIEPKKDFLDVNEKLSRHEARTEGVKKANEIYNERN